MKMKKNAATTLDLPIMEKYDKLSTDGKKFISAVMSIEERDGWHGQGTVPPASLLEDVLHSFERNTDIGLELPFLSTLTYISGFLCAQNVKIKINRTQKISPQIWNIILAKSGSGKTYATSVVGKNFQNNVPTLENTSSGVALIQAIQKTPRGVWIRDEFGQYLRSIQTQPHMEKAKDILLSAYNGEKIEHITKSDSIVVEDYAFSIFGITVTETFLEQVGPESLVDGFAQRFNYLYVEKNDDRKMVDFPVYYSERKMTDCDWAREKKIEDSINKILSRTDLLNATFTIDAKAFQVFENVFRNLYQNDIPESFYRRVMFSMFSYASVYHVLLNKNGTEIDEESMRYASQVVILHLKDIKKLLMNSGWSELELLIQKCESWKVRFEEKHNKKATFRDLVAGVRDIKNTQQAKHMFLIISRKTDTVGNKEGRIPASDQSKSINLQGHQL